MVVNNVVRTKDNWKIQAILSIMFIEEEELNVKFIKG